MEPSQQPERKLSDLFNEGYSGLDAVTQTKEATNSGGVQLQVRRAIAALEQCTRLVSAAGMFSTNEGIEEVSSSNLRYLLLPAILGRLSIQISADANGRLEVVLLAEAYFKDFLRRCRDYGFVQNDEVASILDESPSDGTAGSVDMPVALLSSPRPGTDLTVMVQNRNAKIKRHQEQKEREKRLEELRVAVEKEEVDDEVLREYHLTLLKDNVAQALDELSSLALEKNILQHMARLRKEGNPEDDIPEGQRPPSRRPPSRRPLQPVIITRDEVQKKIFGAGYPSLPTYTVAEFYEQRVKDGIFPGGCGSSTSTANMVHQAPQADEETATELQEEADDPVLLARRRAMDDYKDDHRRGEGNRHNRS